MSDLAQRVEAALAAASATLLSAHAHLSRAAAARLSSRLPPTRTIGLYCRELDLEPVDASWIRMQALARMGAFCLAPITTIPAGAGRVERIRCAIREWLRVQLAPHGDPALQELLELEYAYARAVILKVHVRNAVRFAAAVRPDFSGPAAVALYIDRLRVPDDVRGAVYALAVAQLAAVRFTAMLPATGDVAQRGKSLGEGAAELVPPAFVNHASQTISVTPASPTKASVLGGRNGAPLRTGDASSARRS